MFVVRVSVSDARNLHHRVVFDPGAQRREREKEAEIMRPFLIRTTAAAAALVAIAGSALGDFSFSLADRSLNNTWQNISLSGAASIPSGTYSGIRVTYDFDSNINGTASSLAWSSEGRSWFSTLGANANTNTTPSFPGGNSSYSTSVTSNTGGASNSNDVSGLQFNFSFSSPFSYTGAQSIVWNHRQAFALQGSPAQTVDWRNINVTFISFVPPTPPAAIDLGTLVSGGSLTGSASYVANTVQWYKFNLASAIGSGELFRANTFGNTLTGGQFGSEDTEIALYNSLGNVIASNDDNGSLRWSDIQSTAGLAAGDYYIAASAYNLTANNAFAATAADALAPGTTAITGNIVLNIVPTPGAASLIALSGLVAIRRRRR